jgi:hypothetical protein
MKILICGECPDPLTTVAQGLNRIRAEQMRLDNLLHLEVSSSTPGVVLLPKKDQPADPFVADLA